VALQSGTLHRNFMGYTTRRGLDQLGLGVSSISAVGPTYAQDHKDHAPWRESMDASRMPWERALILDEDDLLRREVILDLSCNLRLDFARFEHDHGMPFDRRFAPELEQLQELVDDSLLELDGDGIRVTPRGRFLVRIACMAFDRYLGGQGDRPVRYSRTV
jgi:oxygen-independent coproporphyrinogen-3 oxidase